MFRDFFITIFSFYTEINKLTKFCIYVKIKQELDKKITRGAKK